MKIMLIPDCGECPESLSLPGYPKVYGHYCTHPEVGDKTIWIQKADKSEYPDFTTPDWCPLPNAPDREGL